MAEMDRIQAHRQFFANLIAANLGIARGSELVEAFASTPREKFVGPPPWKVFTRAGYIEAPSDDPTVLYQDVVVALGSEGPLNNGQPTLHALCIAALGLKKGERVAHVGAGTGYYTSLLAKVVGETGYVDAYEIEPDLARRASANLAEFPHVRVHSRSGTEGELPACDAVYVNAGATGPLAIWLDCLRPNGRLLFPMAPAEGVGAMLLVTKLEDGRLEDGSFAARFLLPAQFVPCVGAIDEATAKRLTDAFRSGNWRQVKSLHRNDTPDDSCWCAGSGWWLSTN
jgi:protein-L-isoaspartate(D-aspartate) O-methyltransferase